MGSYLVDAEEGCWVLPGGCRALLMRHIGRAGSAVLRCVALDVGPSLSVRPSFSRLVVLAGLRTWSWASGISQPTLHLSLKFES